MSGQTEAKELAKQYHSEGLSAFEAEQNLRQMGYVPTDKFAHAVLTHMLVLRNRKPRRTLSRWPFTWQTGQGTAALPKAEYNRVPKLKGE